MPDGTFTSPGAAARRGMEPDSRKGASGTGPKILMPSDWAGMPHNWPTVTNGRRIVAPCEDRALAERVVEFLRDEQ